MSSQEDIVAPHSKKKTEMSLQGSNNDPGGKTSGGVDPWDDPDYINPKWPMDRPKEWKPFLTSFDLFSKFPTEIRQGIWQATLEPRVIDMCYSESRGFHSLVKLPKALRVCADSRKAVKHLYPKCFGNVFHKPMIVFNFSLDTLYLDADFGPDTYSFLLSLSKRELESIQYLAVDASINDFHEWEIYGVEAKDNLDLLRKIVSSISSLREYHFVCKIDEMWHDHGFPAGTGPMTLSETFPYEVQHFMYSSGVHRDDEDSESNCQEPPNMEILLDDLEVAKKGSLWGWRPVNLTALLPGWRPEY